MKKYLFLVLFAGFILCVLGGYQYREFHDRKFHLIFCDVGQGDGILLRTPSGKLIVVDGGPDEKIVGCLGRHTSFWERKITLMVLSHPHADHLNGLVTLLERYSTKYFITERLVNKTAGYEALQEILRAKHVLQKEVFKGDSMTIPDGVVLRILSPTRELLDETSPNGSIGESKEFANLIIHVIYNDFQALLVGDSQAPQIEAAATFISDPLDVIQVPHHGSMTGLSETILSVLKPKLAIISVGKNTYGHPATYTLDLLEKAGIPVMQTMQRGDVEIVTDGKSMKIR